MAPFSMQCTSCGEFIAKGSKFNARKETVQGETYLGIMIFRFYIICPKCAAEITFKTNPQRADYDCEHGARRNYEPWREATEVNNRVKLQKEEEEEFNPMKALENRTKESKREVDILDALDEIRTRNARIARVDEDDAIARLQAKGALSKQEKLAQEEAEDEEALRRAFGPPPTEEVEEEVLLSETERGIASEEETPKKRKLETTHSNLANVAIKRAKPTLPVARKPATKPAPAKAGALSLIGSYGSSDEESS